jgi:hypothetical protein
MAISPDQEREIRQIIINGLPEQEEPQSRRIRPTRIRVMGRFVRLHNGKTLWNQPSHAKAAFTNYLTNIAYDSEFDTTYRETKELIQKVADRMIKNGEAEFVELEAVYQPLQTTNNRNNLK